MRTIANRIDAALGRSALFGRAALATFALCSVVIGFLSGIRASSTDYDPHTYAIGTAALFAAACAVIAFLFARGRRLRATIDARDRQIEELSDRNWELSEGQERARSLLESQGDVIVRRNAAGHVTFASDAFRALAGQDGETLNVLEQGAITALPDGTRMHDQKIACGDGARWIAWREVTVRTDSGAEIQSVGRDVTARAETEHALADARDAAEAASRAKSRFLAMVSHEIRTPLNGMLGMADLLLDTRLTPEQTTYAKAAKRSGETLLSLIEEILDFSKIEAGKLDIDARPLSLLLLVEDVVELLAPRAQAKAIEIASFVDERLPDRVIGDGARLRQVLLNLAGNAVKFTDTGGVAVIVEPGPREHDVTFIVRDTGIGLSPDDQVRVFEEFEQADGSPARKYGGTGLGLAISQRIVTQMGGTIGVDSAPGDGATFTVSVPLPRAAADDVSPSPPLPIRASADLAGQSVLIVASAAIESALLARRLQRWGAACQVEDSAAALPGRHWDTVLVDHAHTRAVARALAASGPSVMRRIALIAPAERSSIPSLRQAGYDGYLVKPVRAASLAERLTASPGGAIAATDETADAPLPRASQGLSILIAEDNEINALLARALLSRVGHRPVIATDGANAVAAWQAARASGAAFDLIVMDIHMPGIDGLEATRRIRAAERTGQGAARTPIVALTANAFGEDRDACLAAGMDGFLVKPLDREKLSETLASLGGKSATFAA